MNHSPDPVRAIVAFERTDDRARDLEMLEAAFRRRIRDPRWRRPRGTVWHDAGDGTLQLVPVRIHGVSPHAGSEPKPSRGTPSEESGRRPASPEPLRRPLPDPPRGLLDSVEEALGVEFPASYRAFLTRNNGGEPRHEVFRRQDGGRERVSAFLGLAPGEEESVFSFLEIYGDRLPDETLPIAYDPFGNLLLLGLGARRGRVYFWSHEHEPDAGGSEEAALSEVAGSFEEFLHAFER